MSESRCNATAHGEQCELIQGHHHNSFHFIGGKNWTNDEVIMLAKIQSMESELFALREVEELGRRFAKALKRLDKVRQQKEK